MHSDTGLSLFRRTSSGSFLISLARIRRLGKAECFMDKDYTVPVSRGNMKPLKEALQRYLKKEAI